MKKMTKRDAVLILIVFLALLVLFLIWRAVYSKPGNYCEITVSGKLYATCPLSAEQEIPIKNAEGMVTNKLKVSQGKARMIDASCPDHLCIHQGPIDERGGMIICLPNQVIIEGVPSAQAQTDPLAPDLIAG